MFTVEVFGQGELVPSKPTVFSGWLHLTMESIIGILILASVTNFQPCPAWLFRRIMESQGVAPPVRRSLRGVPCRFLSLEEWTLWIGTNLQEFSGLSLTSGGASFALTAGRLEAEMMKPGRWKIDTYLRHQAPPDAVMAKLSALSALGEQITGSGLSFAVMDIMDEWVKLC